MKGPPPLFYMALAFMGGLHTGSVAAAAAAGGLLAVFGWYRRRGGGLLAVAALLVLFFLAGNVLGYLHSSPPEAALLRRAAAKSEVEVLGEVSGAARGYGRFTYVPVHARLLKFDRRAYRVAFSLTASVPEEGRGYTEGDRVALKGRVAEGGSPRLYVTDLRSDGVTPSRSRTFVRRFRALAAKNLPRDQAQVLSAMVLGKQGDESGDLIEDFSRAGIVHLFAVSGFNVAIASMFVVLLCMAAGVRRGPALAVSSVSVLFYFSLVGVSPSVVRAVVMIFASFAAWLAARPYDMLSALGAAAIVLLSIWPSWLWSTSFQLSFAAVVGIGLIAPPIAGAFRPGLRKIVTPLSITLGAQAAVAPIVAAIGGEVSLVSVVANLTVAPLVTAVTVVGFAALLISGTSVALASVLLRLSSPLVALISAQGELYGNLSWSTIVTGAWPGLLVIAYYGMVLVACFWLSRHRDRFGWRTFAGVIAIAFAAVFAYQSWQGHWKGPLQVRFLNVGQGDAVLVREKNSGTILIDGGPDRRQVSRRLAALGVRRLDVVILTHAHADHVAGLTSVLRRYEVGMVVDPGLKYSSPVYKEFLDTAKAAHVAYRKARRGDIIRLGPVRIRVYLPDEVFITGSNSDPNNNSIVARLEYGRFALLLPGDIEVDASRKLLRSRPSLASQVLKVAHHGSRTGTSESLYRAVRPYVAVISVGKRNLYGHPHRAVTRLLARKRVRVFRTDRDGEIAIDSDGKRFSVVAGD